jgi:uncharacterized protein (UPF0332 family)
MATPVFDWSEYLKLAKQLAANPDEASRRSSISRAYYCVYHKASERAVSTGYVDQQSHWKLWDVYDRNTDRACRKLSSIGSRMKKERVAADYDSAATRIAERMNVQLDRASDFLTRLSTLAPRLPLP